MSRPSSARRRTQLSLPTASRRTSSSRSVEITRSGRSQSGSWAWNARMTWTVFGLRFIFFRLWSPVVRRSGSLIPKQLVADLGADVSRRDNLVVAVALHVFRRGAQVDCTKGVQHDVALLTKA